MVYIKNKVCKEKEIKDKREKKEVGGLPNKNNANHLLFYHNNCNPCRKNAILACT